jgi:hypothetical protein
VAASSTTRPKGSGIPAGGPGHGGDARGGQSNSKAGVPGPGCLGVTPGEGKAAVKAATFREMLEPHYAAIAEKWKNIALNDAHPHQHTMIIKAGELRGEFKQTVELTGKDGGPIEEIRRVIVDPKHPDTA